MLWCDDHLPRVKKETKPTLRGKWESVFGLCSTGDYCSFSHDLLAPENKGKGQRRKGRSSSPASHSKAKQTDGEEQESSQGSGNKQENSKVKIEIPSRFKFCRNPSCTFWHPPVCLNCMSERRLCLWRWMHFPTCWGRRRAQHEVDDRWGDKMNLENWEQKHGVKLSKSTWHQIKFRERKGVHREVLSKNVRLMSVVLAPEVEGRSHEETLIQERCARKAGWDLAKNYVQAQEYGQN